MRQQWNERTRENEQPGIAKCMGLSMKLHIELMRRNKSKFKGPCGHIPKQ